MDFLTIGCTDVGIRKKTNQDSHSILIASTSVGKILLAIICDGMGGLEKGEVASAHIVKKFSEWFKRDLPDIIKQGNYSDIKYQWNEIVQRENEIIAAYGRSNDVSMGTTLTVSLFLENKIYVMHVGDTRFYEISDDALQIHTEDQTLIAREIRRGNMTPEEGERDPRRNVLLQCIGASKIVEPQYIELNVISNKTYMMCSDGFRHKITEEEIIDAFSPSVLANKNIMIDHSEKLIELNKSRRETDNITVLLIKTV